MGLTTIDAVQSASIICYAIAAVGCIYALAAAWLTRDFAASSAAPAEAGNAPGITILKPLHGAEPGLYSHLASFCAQDYPGPVQILFGVSDPNDPAIPIARRLISDFPELDLELVIDGHRHGTNRKVSNLINMAPRAKYDVLALSDSDIVVDRDYLKNIVAEIDKPDVGIVTCLYRGTTSASPWAHLAAAGIDHHFVPSVLVGLKLRLARPCFGSTIAIRKDTLAMIGGFQAVVEELADDYVMGDLVRRAGLTVAIAPFTVAHHCTHRTAWELFKHELRWARTIRFLDPVGYLGSAVTHALPFALLGTLLGGITPASGLVLVALACRFTVQVQVDRAFRRQGRRLWIGPVRDVLSFAIFLASFLGRAVEWRGHRYKVEPSSKFVYAGEAKP